MGQEGHKVLPPENTELTLLKLPSTACNKDSRRLYILYQNQSLLSACSYFNPPTASSIPNFGYRYNLLCNNQLYI